MRKMGKVLLFSAVICCVFVLGCLLADNHILQENLIRLHVVANSNATRDQDTKLIVRDAVVSYLQEHTEHITTIDDAKVYFQKNIEQIEKVVNQSLQNIGAPYSGIVTFDQEKFSTRVYDTFSLPSGIYHSLRVELGQGEGKNWWCVAFPALCVPRSDESFRATAIEAGFQDTLVDTLSKDDYKIRFFLLDCLGKIENFFYFG